MKKLLVLFLLFLLTSCGQKKEKDNSIRVVSLSPSATEIIYSLGAQNRLVGVTNYCDWPPDAKTKEKVGDFSFPSIEKILSLKPSLIIAAGPGQKKTIEKLKNLGIRTKIYHPETLRELYDSIIDIGSILNQTGKAKKIVNEMKKEISQIPKLNSKKIFIEVCSKPLIAASKKTFISDACERIGLQNVCDFPQSYPTINAEWLIRKNPDFILLTGTKEPDFLALYPFFKKSKILAPSNIDIIVRPGPRIVEGLWEIRWLITKKK
ncbi:MAG: ABC transporter substrate-binding protein [Elusimicrobia bacterium]|nr:ABC transporter substrate-binding protein [Elusimicrobiota bacterium]